MGTLRKLISIDENEYEKLNNYAYKEKISFSEFIRKAADFYIKKQEEMSLSDYLDTHFDYVSEDEEKEILKILEELNKDPEYVEDEGSEITLEQILQGNL